MSLKDKIMGSKWERNIMNMTATQKKIKMFIVRLDASDTPTKNNYILFSSHLFLVLRKLAVM